MFAAFVACSFTFIATLCAFALCSRINCLDRDDLFEPMGDLHADDS